MKACKHCGSPFSPSNQQEEFCCHGCDFVHHMIAEQQLGHYYDLRRDTLATPVKSRPFEQHDFSWFEPLQLHSETAAAGGIAQADVALDGISCVGCVWLIETLFLRHDGAIRAAANPAQSTLHLEWLAGNCNMPAFFAEMTRFGYVAAPANQQSSDRSQQDLRARMGMCGAFMLNAMAFSLPDYLGMPHSFMFADLFRLIAFLSATLAMLVGGSWFGVRAWNALRIGAVHMDLPIALGLIAAYVGSIVGWLAAERHLMYFDFVATFVFLMLVGRTLQTSAVARNRRRLVREQPVPSQFKSPQSDTPTIERDDLQLGSDYLLEPGQANPVSAVLTASRGDFSLEWIHGEAEARTFDCGASVPAGAILLSRHALALQAQEPWRDSLLARLTATAPEERRNPVLEKLLRCWIACILIIGAIGFFYHLWQGHALQGLQVMISVFVVSCPCALGVALPLADDLAAQWLQRWGVFLRSQNFWARLRKVRQVIFDKTGTLTLERPQLENPHALHALSERAATRLAQLTAGSLHPVARSLHEALGARGQRLLGSTATVAIDDKPGWGVSLTCDGETWSLGRPDWLRAPSPADPVDASSNAQTAATPSHRSSGIAATTALRCNGRLIADFEFRDALRPSVVEALNGLTQRHMQLHLLSGDHPLKVQRVAEIVGIPSHHAHAALLPDEKAQRVRQIDRSDSLYFGDGANDSLAFDAALVTGTPVTDRSLLEAKADFFTLGSGLAFLPQIFHIAAMRQRAVHRAFIFALIYNIIVIFLALLGMMQPVLAAIVMPLSSLGSLAIVMLSLSNRSSLIDHSQKSVYHGSNASTSHAVVTPSLS